MKTKTTFLCLFMLFAISSWGQKSTPNENPTFYNTERSIFLKGTSKTQDVVIKVDDKTERLDLSITGLVSIGEVAIEIYDPKGKKQSNFNIKNQLSLDTENKGAVREDVKGEISKSIIEPQIGNWIVKLIPKDVYANIKIKTQVKL
ncbi:hypothetical protein ACG2LH_03635 [Zhouia sp. PK063]|uniref:hypothetical protein n=1 Tax=Zhouia sp. PK063 TaxID=3373602 RepID=UPI0037B5283E